MITKQIYVNMQMAAAGRRSSGKIDRAKESQRVSGQVHCAHCSCLLRMKVTHRQARGQRERERDEPVANYAMTVQAIRERRPEMLAHTLGVYVMHSHSLEKLSFKVNKNQASVSVSVSMQFTVGFSLGILYGHN